MPYRLITRMDLDFEQFFLCSTANISHRKILSDVDRNIILGKLPIAHDAAFNSFTDQHEVECLPGTRTDLLDQITQWAGSPHGKCIFWLNGMAGTGKSTICRTVARSFHEKEQLGASFFFKRGEGDRGSAAKLFPTIAKQLIVSIPWLSASVEDAVTKDPDIGRKSLKEQWDKLILQPLLQSKPPDQQGVKRVVVIDALDECDREEDIRLIIRLLPQLWESKSLHLQVFLTSRPELPTRLGFRDIADGEHQDCILNEIAQPVIQHDIHLFLKHQLSEIQRD